VSSIDKTMDRTIDRLADIAPSARKRGPGLLKRMAGRFGDRTVARGPDRPVDPAAQLHAILAMQSADGWFGWSDAIDHVGQALVKNWSAVRREVQRRIDAIPPNPAMAAERVSRTVIILLLLRTRFADQRSSWRRAHDKAVRWLAALLRRDSKGTEQWLTSLEASFAA
jgi:hypothetical protein